MHHDQLVCYARNISLPEIGDIGQSKVRSAEESIYDLNPDVTIIPYEYRLDALNIDKLTKDYDIVADGWNNFQTRFLVNEYCFKHKRTLVSAAVIGFTGHLYTFKPYIGEPYPCYQCIYPELPASGATESCSQSGVLGSVTGQMGAWQAIEIIKELLGIGTSISGQMIVIDALSASVRKIKINRSSNCPCCGKEAK